ncbi:MAG: FAD-dependent oxidoreductase, partial [bacterium]
MTYDLGIIGAGPAGYVAAERAGNKGLSTVLFDKQFIGGVCLNEGCIPTKTLLHTAKLYEYAKEGKKYGLELEGISYDISRLMQRKNKMVKKLVGGIKSQLKNSRVEMVMEEAAVLEKTPGHIKIQAGDDVFECRNLLLATGSETSFP